MVLPGQKLVANTMSGKIFCVYVLQNNNEFLFLQKLGLVYRECISGEKWKDANFDNCIDDIYVEILDDVSNGYFLSR